MLRMKEPDVRCIYIDGSGCYGRNGHEDAAADAVLIAREAGKPVRVQWMRADEHGWDPKGPPTLIDYRGALDAKGNIVGWESEVFIPDRPSQDHSGDAGRRRPRRDCRKIPRIRVTSTRRSRFRTPSRTSRRPRTRLAETPFQPSWIRTPGRMQNTFGNESSWTNWRVSPAPIRSNFGCAI